MVTFCSDVIVLMTFSKVGDKISLPSVTDKYNLSYTLYKISTLRLAIFNHSHEIITALIVGIFLIASFAIISSIPLGAKKNWIISMLRKDNITINISGVVNFNIFLMKYVVNDSEVVAGAYGHCSSGVKLRIPKMYVDPFTNAIQFSRPTIIAIVGGEGESLYKMISSRLNNNVRSITVKDGTLNIAKCDDVVVKSLDDLSYDYGNVRNKITTSLYIKELTASTSGGKHTINGIISGSEYTAKLKYITDHTNVLNLNIQSDPMDIKIDVDRYRATKGEIIGSYDLKISDLGALYSVIGGDNLFLNNISNKVIVDSSGPIVYRNNVIESSSKVNTSCGSGTLKVLMPDTSFPTVSLSFEKLSHNDKECNLLPSNDRTTQFDMVGVIWNWLMHIDHGFKLNINEINGDVDKITDLSVEYKINNERFTPIALAAQIPGGKISLYQDSQGKINNSTRDISWTASDGHDCQGIEDVSVMLDVNGTDILPFLRIVENIIASGNIFALSPDQKMYGLSYKGKVVLSIGTNNTGISSFDLRFKNVKIAGSYLTHNRYIDGKNSHEFTTRLARLNFINTDFTKLFSKELLQSILKKIYIINDSSAPRRVIFNDMIISSTSEPVIFDLNAQNCYLGSNAVSSLGLNGIYGEEYFVVKMLNIDSQFLSGSANILIDIDNPNPTIKLNARLSNIDTVRIEGIVDLINANQSRKISYDDQFNEFLNQRINIPSFSQFSGDFSVQIMNLHHKILSMRNVYLVGKIVNGSLHFDDISLSTLGGSIKFSGIVDTMSTPRVSLRLSAIDLDISKVLKAIANVDNVATGLISIDRGGFDGSGFSIREIAGTLDGRLSVNASNVKFTRFDIISLANSLISTRKYTGFDVQSVLQNDTESTFPSASGDIRIRSGVADTDGIVMKASGVSGMIQFNVDLRTRMINNIDNRFIIIVGDPRKDSKYLELLVIAKAIGDLDHPQSRVLLDQVNDYVKQMSVMDPNTVVH